MELVSRCQPSLLHRLLWAAVLWQITKTDCPGDGRTWVTFQSSCYHFVHGQEDVAKGYTMTKAESFCQANGTGLVQINNVEENEFIITYSPQVWKGNLNIWLGMTYDTKVKKFLWLDRTPLSYKNWEESSDLSPVDTCVALHLSTGKWVKVSCADDPEYGVVCQAPGEVLDDCPKDRQKWVASGRKCLLFVQADEGAKAYSFQRAKEQCKGYELLQIESKEENQYIVDYSPNVWKNNINVWLGMFYDTDADEFTWFNNATLDYRNFEDEEDPLEEGCAVMHTSSGKWMKVSCQDDLQHGVVCEAANKPEETMRAKGNPFMTGLVIVSVLSILGISAGVWFAHQRHSQGVPILSSFEYHPPFRSPGVDETCLVEAEELEDQS